jgi:uncharacterized membrane protein
MFDDLPLHPSVVHVPLGLALLLPAVVAWCTWRAFRDDAAKPLWGMVAFLQLVVALAAFVALSLGEKDAEAVVKIVGRDAMSAHEASGKQFAWGALAAFAVTSMLLGVSGRGLRNVAIVALVASLLSAGLALRAGSTGGRLVYVHGAADAHVEPAGAVGSP